MMYFVLCDYASGAAWAERTPPNTDREQTLIDIRSGELARVIQVLECDRHEGLCRDATRDDDFQLAIYIAEARENGECYLDAAA